MKNNSHFSFTAWLASANAVSFCLLIGVVFLISNYQAIVYRANPDNLIPFQYPYFLQVLLSHIDSFFFGLATAIIIFQSRAEWHKVMYCCLESVMIFLNLNRLYIDKAGISSQFVLGMYLSIFSGFTLYYLGTLAIAQFKEARPNEGIQSSVQSQKTKNNTMYKGDQNGHQNGQRFPKMGFVTATEKKRYAYLKKHKDVVKSIQAGATISEASALHGLSESTISKVKLVMTELNIHP